MLFEFARLCAGGESQAYQATHRLHLRVTSFLTKRAPGVEVRGIPGLKNETWGTPSWWRVRRETKAGP